MRIKKDKTTPVVLLAGLALWVLLGIAEENTSSTFRYSVDVGGFDSPTNISYLRLNKTIGFPLKGYISGGEPDRTIFGSSMGLYKPEPVPYQVDARWFSYQNEQFYQIKLEIPEEKQQAIRDFYRQYPDRDYTHSLQLGISGEGDLRLYWEAFCLMIEGCPSEPRKQLEIYDRVPAKTIDVDLTEYKYGFSYAYRREQMLCDGIFSGEPSYTLPDDILTISDELDDYRRLRVSWLGNSNEPLTYSLEYRDGSTTSGIKVRDGGAVIIGWDEPYNPPYRMRLAEVDGEVIRIAPNLSPGGVGIIDRAVIEDSGYIYLDQRFLLPSREHFEWPEWAKELRWQDLRGECKISTYVRLRDVDGEVVAGGVYELIDNETGEVLMKERTDMQGFTRVRRSDYLSNDWSFQ